jgi:hypothetical protein
MAIKFQCPLTMEHCEQLKTLLEATAAADEYMRMNEAAGLDMSGYRQTLDEQAKLAKGLLRVYFPQEAQHIPGAMS